MSDSSSSAPRLAFRRGAQAAADASNFPVTAEMRSSNANRYAGTCTECGQEVRAGEGIASREGTRWVVTHRDGQHPMVTVTSLPRIEASNGQVYMGSVLPGIYTITDKYSHHETYRVRVQSSDDAFAPGETIIEFLSGSDNAHDYTSFGFVRNGALVVWRKYRESTDAAVIHRIGGAQAFLRNPERAVAARTCIRCNALLTTPESIARGLGPTCADKGW